MEDATGNSYCSGRPSRISHSRQSSTPDEQNIIPHLLVSIPCDYHPYLDASENAQNISVQFTGQDTTQLDPDILQRRISFDENANMAAHPIAYPESSQRTTSHALSPYATDASRFNDFSSCDIATLHIDDAPVHGIHTPRRGSWPSQMEYSVWTQSPPRGSRSAASEPPESTSDESYQDSDVDEATQMSPMMNQFQIHAARSVDLPLHHMYHAQALQPSVMTFQLSETMLQPVDDPENRQTFHHLVEMNIAADDRSEVTHPLPSSSTLLSSSLISFGDARLQGPSMRFQHDGEKQNRTTQYRVPAAQNSVPFPSPSSTNTRVGDQRTTGVKQPKKSKMHQCEQCKKLFPRPSGLATHMNSHSGAKPYKCILPTCDKSFAVRSNAKRHLRTHGINPASHDALSKPHFMVGFEEPMVTQVHDAGRQPSRYRWITHNPSSHSSSAMGGSSHTGLTFQTSMSSATSSSLSNVSDEDHEQVASSSVADAQQYQGDYRGADEFHGSYPNYGQHPRGG